jgi:uncharacterized OsmC-like protein
MTAGARSVQDRRMTTALEHDVDARICESLVRLETALRRRPGFGRTTSISTTTVVAGLRCHSSEGVHGFDTDLPSALGGDSNGPTPGALLRAALGSCLAMCYRLRAARAGVQLRSIRVVVESDAEIEGMLDPGSSVPAGFTNLRYHVEIESDAAPRLIEQIVDEAERLSPILDAVGRANAVVRSLEIVTGGD